LPKHGAGILCANHENRAREIVMGTIAATASSAGYGAVAQLLTDSLSNAAATAGNPQTGQTAGSAAPTSSGNPADTVDLSDRAKAALAQAQKNQVAANQLQAFVQSNRGSGSAAKNYASGQSTQSSSTSGQGADSVMQAFDQLTGQPPSASTDQAGGNQPSSADSWGASIFPDAFVPTRHMSTSVTLGGFTVSVQSDPSRLASQVQVSGNGVSTWMKHFWPSDAASGGSGSPPGISVSIGSNPNNAAEDIVTITQNQATATSVSASSSKGSASIAAVSAQSSSMTFVINYATGEITASQSSESISALSAARYA
jgi:hypothetical protein